MERCSSRRLKDAAPSARLPTARAAAPWERSSPASTSISRMAARPAPAQRVWFGAATSRTLRGRKSLLGFSGALLRKVSSGGKSLGACMNATEHIFVSYARRDTTEVDRIVEALRGAGYRVWIDRGGIFGARLWRKEIVAAIRDSNAFVIALSPHAVASTNVQKELILSDQYGRHVVPVLLAKTTIPDEMQYPLAGIQYVDWQSFDEGFEELCRTLKGLNIECLDLSTAAGAQPKPAASWWRGALGAFGATA